MAADEQKKQSWRQRRRAAKREKAARSGDSPEKAAEHQRESSDPDMQATAARAGITSGLTGGF
jgi:hypothetical protein